VPGKLDHASIVCYQIGYHDEKNTLESSDPELPEYPGDVIAGISFYKNLVSIIL